jgi:hypothetical protein
MNLVKDATFVARVTFVLPTAPDESSGYWAPVVTYKNQMPGEKQM